MMYIYQTKSPRGDYIYRENESQRTMGYFREAQVKTCKLSEF